MTSEEMSLVAKMGRDCATCFEASAVVAEGPAKSARHMAQDCSRPYLRISVSQDAGRNEESEGLHVEEALHVTSVLPGIFQNITEEIDRAVLDQDVEALRCDDKESSLRRSDLRDELIRGSGFLGLQRGVDFDHGPCVAIDRQNTRQFSESGRRIEVRLR